MRGNKIILVLLSIFIILIIALWIFIYKMKTIESNDKAWQAVFLTNGQVYFGHLSDLNEKYIKLADIYYLQVQKALQPKPEKEESKLSLIKLGNELHGPTDQMNINRDQVLFYEELKSDSKVVKAIEEYQNKK